MEISELQESKMDQVRTTEVIKGWKLAGKEVLAPATEIDFKSNVMYVFRGDSVVTTGPTVPHAE